MGFDIDCIIDIHTYPGEYFCPVCRTLVYPNEALQSRCTHLYCKPCLVHVANSTKACPYDGYLVTESDSKPLVDSDKELSEKVGKVRVHCLYFRSGCAFEGILSDCISHCSVCSFGNSPVICNRCGLQIVHRQVHEHAQSCPGAYGGQPTTLTTSTVVGAQTIVPSSQGQQNPQNANPVQTPNPQVNPGAQAPAAVPTQAQWNQQYQQYYQQYGGLDPYQQAMQNYYAVQQQPLPQHYEQHQVNVQSQTMPLANVQTQGMSQTIPAQPQTQLMPQHQSQVHAQAPIMSTNYQVQPQPSQPPPYAQPLGVRPPSQHPQITQYPQPHVQMPQAQPQPHMHSQNLGQPHFPPPNQPHLQSQSQATAYHHTQAQPPVLQPQAQQFATPGLPQPSQPPFPAVTGHQSYPRPQSAPQIQSGTAQQHQLQSNFAHGSAFVGNMHGQAPAQQPPLVRPSHSHGSIPHQNPSMLQPQPTQIPDVSTPYKQFPSTNPGVPMQPPIQQAAPHQFAEQQSSSALQSQSHQQGHFPPVPPQMPPYAVHQQQQSQHHPLPSTMPNQPVHPQNHSLQSVSFGPMSNSVPALPVSAQTAMNQGYAQSIVPNANMQAPLFPSKEIADKGMKGDSRVEAATTRVSKTTAKESDSATGNVIKSGFIEEAVGVHGQLMQTLTVKSFADDAVKIGFRKEEGSSLQDSRPFKQIKPENLITSNMDKQLGTAVSAPDTGRSLDIREERKPGFLHPPPQSYESQAIDLGAANQHSVADKVPRSLTTLRDEKSGSVEGGNLVKSYNDKPNLYGVDGGKGPDSMFNSRDEKMKVFARENMYPLPTEPTRDLDRAPFSLKASYLPGFKDGFKSDPLVQSPSFLQPHPATDHGRAPTFEREPDFGQRHPKHYVPRSPGWEFLGSSPRRFGGPSGYPQDPSAVDNANIRIRPLAGHMLRGDIDGPGTHGFHGQGGPANLKREEHMGPRHLSVHGRSGEFGGPVNLPHVPLGGSVADERSGFPLLKASVMSPRPPHAWASAGSVEPFDQFRRRPVSAGWCRICELDCETVEGLDLHSQTRAHQNRAMDIVNNIKMQNRKRTRTPFGHLGHEGGSRGRKGTNGGRGARGGRGGMV